MAEQRPRHLSEPVDTVMQLTEAEFAILVAGFNAGAATLGARAADRGMAPAHAVGQIRDYLAGGRPDPDGSVGILLTLSHMLNLEWCWWAAYGHMRMPDENDETRSVRFKLADKTPARADDEGAAAYEKD